MRKELTFTMSQQIIDMASKPLRKREDAILLLLYTIRMFDLDKSELNIHNESIRISINKIRNGANGAAVTLGITLDGEKYVWTNRRRLSSQQPFENAGDVKAEKQNL